MQLTIYHQEDGPAEFSLNPGEVTTLGHAVYDADRIAFVLRGIPHGDSLWLRIGDGSDRSLAEPKIYPDAPSTGNQTFRAEWAVATHFHLYAGRCTVSIETQDDIPRLVCAFEILVQPSHLTQQQYQAILTDLQRRERGLLLDVYGKTYLTVNEQAPPIPSEIPAEEFLAKARQAVTVLERELTEIRRHPQQGFRVSLSSRQYLPGQPLHSREVAALCRRPDGLVPTRANDPMGFVVNGRPTAIARVSTMETITDYDVYEHRAIRWFLQRLLSSMGQLQRMALAECEQRISDRAWKDYRSKPNQATWWETEDQPRLQPLLDRAALCDSLSIRISRLLRRHPCLQELGPFTPPLVSTATFARRPAYRKVFQVMSTLHQVGGVIRFHGEGEQLRARDLSKLFEYWCAFRVLGELTRRFRPLSVGEEEFFDTHRFVVQMKPDSEAWFRSGDGRYVRFRYEPRYWTKDVEPSRGYGRVHGWKTLWTPDVAVEIFQKQTDRVPRFIYTFDAKYSSPSIGPSTENIKTACEYRDGIGTHQGRGSSLVQHSWLLMPGEEQEDWSVHSPPDFDKKRYQANEVVSVGYVPLNPAGDRLKELVDRLFELDDVEAFAFRKQQVG